MQFDKIKFTKKIIIVKHMIFKVNIICLTITSRYVYDIILYGFIFIFMHMHMLIRFNVNYNITRLN